MNRYRKRPVVIEAVQLQENWTEVCNWINSQGEFYPVKPQIFEATYEPAS